MSRRSGYTGRGAGGQTSHSKGDARARRSAQAMSTNEMAGEGLRFNGDGIEIDAAKAQKRLIRFPKGSFLKLDRGEISASLHPNLSNVDGVLGVTQMESIQDVSSGASTATLASKLNEILRELRARGLMVS